MIEPLDLGQNVTDALQYLTAHLQGSVHVDQLGIDVLMNQCESIAVVCSPGLPPQQSFEMGWGGKRSDAVNWLISTVGDYLINSPHHVVLVEDAVASPKDYILKNAGVPFWSFQERVLWPITPSMADHQTIQRVFAWAAGGREVIGFGTYPTGNPDSIKDTELTESMVTQLAESLTALVTDIYDGEGYMIWKTRS